MMTMEYLDHAEFGRLMGRGLPASTALHVLDGKCNENSEVAHVETTAHAREWCAGLTTLPQGLSRAGTLPSSILTWHSTANTPALRALGRGG